MDDCAALYRMLVSDVLAYARETRALGQEIFVSEAVPSSAPVAEAAPSGDAATLLAVHHAEIADCQRCPLGASRRKLVFGVGNPNADIVFVGEAPGEDEDRAGEPFVGRAGQLLTRIINAMGLAREDIYICNVLKCRPPGNRDPLPDEVAACEPNLLRQLGVIKPKAIVALGRFACISLFGEPFSITRERGHWREYDGIPAMPTFHPSYLLRKPEAKREVWDDMKEVMRRLELKSERFDPRSG